MVFKDQQSPQTILETTYSIKNCQSVLNNVEDEIEEIYDSDDLFDNEDSIDSLGSLVTDSDDQYGIGYKDAEIERLIDSEVLTCGIFEEPEICDYLSDVGIQEEKFYDVLSKKYTSGKSKIRFEDTVNTIDDHVNTYLAETVSKIQVSTGLESNEMLNSDESVGDTGISEVHSAVPCHTKMTPSDNSGVQELICSVSEFFMENPFCHDPNNDNPNIFRVDDFDMGYINSKNSHLIDAKEIFPVVMTFTSKVEIDVDPVKTYAETGVMQRLDKLMDSYIHPSTVLHTVPVDSMPKFQYSLNECHLNECSVNDDSMWDCQSDKQTGLFQAANCNRPCVHVDMSRYEDNLRKQHLYKAYWGQKPDNLNVELSQGNQGFDSMYCRTDKQTWLFQPANCNTPYSRTL